MRFFTPSPLAASLALALLSISAVSALTDEELAQQARANLRPASGPSSASAEQPVRRRSELRKLASRQSGAVVQGYGIIDPRADSGMPLPMQIRARAAAAKDEDPDVEDDFDCQQYLEEQEKKALSSSLAAAEAKSQSVSQPQAPSAVSTWAAPSVDATLTGPPSLVQTAAATPSSPSSRNASINSSPSTVIPSSPVRAGYAADGADSSAGSSSTGDNKQSCSRYHTVVSGEICLGIINYPENAGLSLNTFLAWNPAIDSSCTNLYIGQTLCVARASSKRRRSVLPAPFKVTLPLQTSL